MSSPIDPEQLQEDIRQVVQEYVYPIEHAVPVSAWMAKDIMGVVARAVWGPEHVGHGTPCEDDPVYGTCGAPYSKVLHG